MKNEKYHIELYSYNGVKQGYLTHISMYHNKIQSSVNINEAKSYSSIDRAKSEGELAAVMTHGGLLYKVVKH